MEEYPLEQAFRETVREAQHDIEQAIQKGGLRDDPFRYPLAALATILDIFPDFIQQVRQAVYSELSNDKRKKLEKKRKKWRLFLAIFIGVIAIACLCYLFGYWQGYQQKMIHTSAMEKPCHIITGKS